jgi:hypothetical protein
MKYLLFICLMLASVLVWADDRPLSDEEKGASSKEAIERIIEELDNELKPAPVEEDISPVEALKKISEKMSRAEDYLSRSSVYRKSADSPANRGNNDDAVKAQEEATKEINRLLNKTKNTQKEVIGDIDKLIKSAKSIMDPEGKGGGSSKHNPSTQDQAQPKQREKDQPQPSNQQPQPIQQTPKEPSNPAQKAYEASGGLPEGLMERRGTAHKWGNLPPKLRDELIQNDQEDFLPDYEEWLKQYFKTLAEE